MVQVRDWAGETLPTIKGEEGEEEAGFWDQEVSLTPPLPTPTTTPTHLRRRHASCFTHLTLHPPTLSPKTSTLILTLALALAVNLALALAIAIALAITITVTITITITLICM